MNKKKRCPVDSDNPYLCDKDTKDNEEKKDKVAEDEEVDKEKKDRMGDSNKEEYMEESDNDSDDSEAVPTFLRSRGHLSSEDDG